MNQLESFMKSLICICSFCICVLLLGCTATTNQLKSRASFDFDCPQEQLTITKIDQATRGVSGCGKKGVYVKDCSAGGRGFDVMNPCTWISDSDDDKLK